LIKSTAGFEGALAASDVCVCPAPYNTSVLLMKHKKKAVLIPLEGSKFVELREQVARARMLKDVLGSTVLPFVQLNARQLARKIEEALKLRGGVRAVPAEWLRGKDIFIKAFRKDVGRR
jgi:predicted glycosyltransferase